MSSGLVIEYSRSIYKVHEISDHTLGYYSNKRVVLIVNKGKAIDCVFLELYVYSRMEVVNCRCDEGEKVSGDLYIVELGAVDVVTDFPKVADVQMRQELL
jgi:hypothetical protein